MMLLKICACIGSHARSVTGIEIALCECPDFEAKSTETYPIFPHANATDMPNPDPKEDYCNVNYRLLGLKRQARIPRGKTSALSSTAKLQPAATGADIPVQIMDPSSLQQVPVISHVTQLEAEFEVVFGSEKRE